MHHSIMVPPLYIFTNGVQRYSCETTALETLLSHAPHGNSFSFSLSLSLWPVTENELNHLFNTYTLPNELLLSQIQSWKSSLYKSRQGSMDHRCEAV